MGEKKREARSEKREECGAPSDWFFSLLTSRFSLLLDQVLLKHHQVIRMGRVPADADHVVTQAHGEVDELALVVHAFAADELVTMIFRPGLLGFLKLAADPVAAELGNDPAQPVIEHARLELEPNPEPNGFIVHPGEERQGVVAPHEASFEK